MFGEKIMGGGLAVGWPEDRSLRVLPSRNCVFSRRSTRMCTFVCVRDVFNNA